MKSIARYLCAAIALGIATGCTASSPTTAPTTAPTTQAATVSVQSVSTSLAKIRETLDGRMNYQDWQMSTGEPADATTMPATMASRKPRSLYGPTGYPMAVIYAGILSAADATGDPAYTDFVSSRFQFFAKTEPGFEHSRKGSLYQAWIRPTSLDSCGAMGSAFIKAKRAGIDANLQPLIDRFADFVRHQQYRLDDGTLARKRPYPQSIWADDMYMSVPLLAQMGALTNDRAYFDDAAWQVEQISNRLFVPGVGLYTHGWHAGAAENQPHYYWGRANGWCAMAMVELLDVLPESHPKRPIILNLLKAHAKGLASVQASSGLWHQLLDRNDSYEETSCSAMFTYAIARAVNHGWLDAGTYGPVAIAGWKGLASRIDDKGQVTGTCVGTSYASDYPYYYNRKMTDDPHGYGPVLLAGSEIIRLLSNPHLKVQDIDGPPISVTPK